MREGSAKGQSLAHSDLSSIDLHSTSISHYAYAYACMHVCTGPSGSDAPEDPTGGAAHLV